MRSRDLNFFHHTVVKMKIVPPVPAGPQTFDRQPPFEKFLASTTLSTAESFFIEPIRSKRPSSTPSKAVWSITKQTTRADNMRRHVPIQEIIDKQAQTEKMFFKPGPQETGVSLEEKKKNLKERRPSLKERLSSLGVE